MLNQRSLDSEVSDKVRETKVIKRGFIVEELIPNVSGLHVLAHVVDCSLKYGFALLLILVLQIVILDCKVDEFLP